MSVDYCGSEGQQVVSSWRVFSYPASIPTQPEPTTSTSTRKDAVAFSTRGTTTPTSSTRCTETTLPAPKTSGGKSSLADWLSGLHKHQQPGAHHSFELEEKEMGEIETVISHPNLRGARVDICGRTIIVTWPTKAHQHLCRFFGQDIINGAKAEDLGLLTHQENTRIYANFIDVEGGRDAMEPDVLFFPHDEIEKDPSVVVEIAYSSPIQEARAKAASYLLLYNNPGIELVLILDFKLGSNPQRPADDLEVFLEHWQVPKTEIKLEHKGGPAITGVPIPEDLVGLTDLNLSSDVDNPVHAYSTVLHNKKLNTYVEATAVMTRREKVFPEGGSPRASALKVFKSDLFRQNSYRGHITIDVEGLQRAIRKGHDTTILEKHLRLRRDKEAEMIPIDNGSMTARATAKRQRMEEESSSQPPAKMARVEEESNRGTA